MTSWMFNPHRLDGIQSHLELPSSLFVHGEYLHEMHSTLLVFRPTVTPGATVIVQGAVTVEIDGMAVTSRRSFLLGRNVSGSMSSASSSAMEKLLPLISSWCSL
jgi:hypothetical protein